MIFYVSALLGGVWLIAWLVFTTSIPAERSKSSAIELHEIEMKQASHPSVTESSWVVLLAPQVLLLSLSYLCLAYGLWAVTFWMPTYLVKARGVSLLEMGWIGMIPTIASFLGLVSGGMLSDALLCQGFSTRFARAQGPSLCIALAVPFLMTAALVSHANVTVTCFTSIFSS